MMTAYVCKEFVEMPVWLKVANLALQMQNVLQRTMLQLVDALLHCHMETH